MVVWRGDLRWFEGVWSGSLRLQRTVKAKVEVASDWGLDKNEYVLCDIIVQKNVFLLLC